MNPVRLIDDSNSDLADLLRAAQDATAAIPEGQKEIVWQSLSATPSATTVGASVKAGAAMKGVVAKWIVASVFSITAVGAYVHSQRHEAPARIIKGPSQQVTQWLEATGIDSKVPIVDVPRHADIAQPPGFSKNAAGLGRTSAISGATSPPRAPARESLDEEARLLTRANEMLASGDLEGAKEQLAAHAKRFPNGALKIEHEVIEIETRKKAKEDVAPSIDSFKKAHPESPHVGRLSEAPPHH